MSNSQIKKKITGIFTQENVAKVVFFALAAFSAVAVLAIVLYLLLASLPAFREIGLFKLIFGETFQIQQNLFGLRKLIVGTLALTVCSVGVGGSLALFAAVWLVYYCPKRLKKLFEQFINLLAGIPSIVYGLFALKFLMPSFVDMFGANTIGYGLLTSTAVLSIMILPTVTAMIKNSLNNVPESYFYGSLALGASEHQTVWKVMLPAAKRGIIAGVILGTGRAIGETMAVQWVVGNGSGYPSGAFVPFTTLTSNIVTNWGYATTPLKQSALLANGFVLLILVFILNLFLILTHRQPKAQNGGFFSRIFHRKFSKSVGGEKIYRQTGGGVKVLCVISWIISAFIAFILAFLVIFVCAKGFPHLTLDFVFGRSYTGHITLVPALISTAIIIVIALAVSVPLGIGAAIYLNEYAKKGKIAVKLIRIFTDTLAGVPSIIFGLFGYVFFVIGAGWGYSLAAGGVTLALMVLPTVIRSSEQSLSEVEDGMREASYALGAGKIRTIFKVVLPQSVSGVITGVILAVGRIVNESAALIYTAGGYAAYAPTGIMDKGASLAVLVYLFANEGLYVNEAYATASALIICVIALNVSLSIAGRAFKRGK